MIIAKPLKEGSFSNNYPVVNGAKKLILSSSDMKLLNSKFNKLLDFDFGARGMKVFFKNLTMDAFTETKYGDNTVVYVCMFSVDGKDEKGIVRIDFPSIFHPLKKEVTLHVNVRYDEMDIEFGKTISLYKNVTNIF